MDDQQSADGQDVALLRLGEWIEQRINARYSGAIGAIATSAQIPTNTFSYRTLNLYRMRCRGASLSNCQIRIEYLASPDTVSAQSGDANLRTLSLAIAQALREWGLMQHGLPPIQVELGSLDCLIRFPMMRIDFNVEDLTQLNPF